ncbi:MAG: sigma 54-interacting transcriptional regulator [Myxococcales bacterium]
MDVPPPQNDASAKALELIHGVAVLLQAPATAEYDALSAVLRRIAHELGFERMLITALGTARDVARGEAAFGLSPDQLGRARYHLGEGIVGRVLDSARPTLVPCVEREPEFLNRAGARSPFERKQLAFLCAPILHRGQAIGTLSADRRLGDDCDLNQDLRLLCTLSTMLAPTVLLRQEQLEEAESLRRESQRKSAQAEEAARAGAILIGNSGPMQTAVEMVRQVAPSEATVLIRGESGTGKELIASAIHAQSPRRSGPFVAVNCGSIPEQLVESELFGHVKGAFTGASMNRVGRFEAASGGTLFLDEIGELTMASQVKLLRALQSRQIDRVGDTRARPIDVRVVAATNADLEQMIRTNRFREDLYYRLNVFPIHLPALRERKGDIQLLAEAFLERFAKEHGRQVTRISQPALDLMLAHHWPGNVRELENCVARAVLLASDGVIRTHHLPPTLQRGPATPELKPASSLHDAMMAYEREILVEAMKNTGGNQAQAARVLGTTARILGYRLRRHGLHGDVSSVR